MYKLLEIIRWIFWNLLGRILIYMPRQIVYVLGGRLLAVLYSRLDRRRKSFFEKGLKFIQSPAITQSRSNEIIRQSFGQLIKFQLEPFIFPGLNKKKIQKMTILDGRDLLERALSGGKGAILLNSHFGSFQMVIAALGWRGYKVGQIAIRLEEMQDKVLIDSKVSRIHAESIKYRQKLETSLPVAFIHAGKFMGPAFKILKKNGILIIAGDGRQGRNFVTVPFFNQPAFFSLGAFNMAEKTGAPVLPTFTVRLENNQHLIRILEPVFPNAALPGSDSKLFGLTAYIRHLERFVTNYPDHYLHFIARSIELLRDDEIPLFKE